MQWDPEEAGPCRLPIPARRPGGATQLGAPKGSDLAPRKAARRERRELAVMARLA